MSKKQVEATFDHGSVVTNISLSLISWEDGGVYYMYAPALDLTGYGNSEAEATSSFEHTLNEFVEYTYRKKTIFDELERLGWTVNRKKKRFRTPDMEELMLDNETYREVLNIPGAVTQSRNVELAV